MSSFSMIRQTIERANRRSGPEARRLPTKEKDPESRITEKTPKTEQGREKSTLARGLDVLKRLPTRPAPVPEPEGMTVEKAVEHIKGIVGHRISGVLVKQIDEVLEELFNHAWQTGINQAQEE